MRRREFMQLAAGVATAWKPASAAAKTERIGLIGVGPRLASRELVDAFRGSLAALGWTDGGNIAILERWAEDRIERLPGMIEELIGSGVDILVTAGTPATRDAASVTAGTPIVFVGVGDPLAIGIVASLSHPGGNATGLSLTSRAVIAERLRLLRELLPNLRRVAVIIRHDPSLEQTLLDIRSNADRMGLELFAFEVTTGSTVKLAFEHLQNDRCDALYLASGPLGPAKRAEIIELAAKARLPAIYSFAIYTVAGGLMSFAADDRDLFHRAAIFVDRILKGTKPADLPVEPPAKFNLGINLKTAEALGLTVPPSLLAHAKTIVE